MATYFWLGVTGNNLGLDGSNVNIPQNWSLWGPGASGSTLISSPTIPKYNSNIVFTRYEINGDVFPKFPPYGDMQGICGPAGAPNAQYFSSVLVLGDYPKGLGLPYAYGGGISFSFATSEFFYRNGSTFNPSTHYANKIYFVDTTGVTQANCDAFLSIRAESLVGFTMDVAGTVNTFAIIPTSPVNQIQNRSKIYLHDLGFTGVTYDGVLSVRHGDVFVGENMGFATGAVNVSDRGALYLNKGVAIDILQIANLDSEVQNPTQYPIIKFLPESNTNSSGPSASRSYVGLITMNLGTYTPGNENYSSPLLPIIEFNHGVDVVDFKSDCGIVKFNQDPTSDVVVIQKGYWNPARVRMLAPNLTSSIGVNGNFIVDANSFSEQEFKAGLRGNWRYKIETIPGYTG